VLIELLEAGLPASFAPMAMVAGTAPGTLAGTLAQENAEILAGVVISQVLAPGAPVMYGGIPHAMDPRTGICAFGSPEQGLMAVAMVELARFYGFPVYVNVGLTDAKLPDAQAGIEKAGSLILGLLAGADTFGHAGICGTDHAASLSWLLLDHELLAYAQRVARGFNLSATTLATDVVERVGPAGHFLAEEHTAQHYRQELWLPGPAWTRQAWDAWENEGGTAMADRLAADAQRLLATHQPPRADQALAHELDAIVDAARRELG
jgi:trimethylamine---corrinoid protein Co-methyltransferase